MSDTAPLTPYELMTAALASVASEQDLPVAPLQGVLDRVLAEQGLTAQLDAEQLEGLLFPTLDQAYAPLMAEEQRQPMLRGVSEQLAAQELGAAFSRPVASAERSVDLDAAPRGPSGEWDFGEDEFEFEDPEYLTAPSARAYDLGSDTDQGRLIADLGRVNGVQSVMVCRQNGEVVQSRSIKDLSALGSVVAATVMLLRQHSLRLMSAQISGTVVCIRPLGDYAVAVLADPGVNAGRLLTELGQIQVERRA